MEHQVAFYGTPRSSLRYQETLLEDQKTPWNRKQPLMEYKGALCNTGNYAW